MESDPALDHEVAVEVMIYKPCGHWGCGPTNGPDCWHDSRNRFADVKHFHPSSSRDDMWRVIDALSVEHVRPDRGASHAIYGFALERETPSLWRAYFGIHSAEATTARRAVCLAALKAVR